MMRIAVSNPSRRKVGGTEAYLGEVIAELQALGHETGLFCEVDTPARRERIPLPDGCPVWCVSELSSGAALAAIRAWRPDLIYAHGMFESALEEQLLEIAPAVFFVHNYYGTCISGDKTFKYPVVRPCSRRFGWPCLMHYFPHRCGGLSPLTMWRHFRLQSRRLQLLRRYRALVTDSAHMKSEILKYGFSPGAVHISSYLVERSELISEIADVPAPQYGSMIRSIEAPWQLLFVGRMDRLKGGRVLIGALPLVAASLDSPVRLTLAGDGPDRAVWQKLANAVQASDPRIRIDFVGWLDEIGMNQILLQSDLLVVPSLWPEPFGRIGPEAGLHSLPVAAFRVGGIPEWLVDGVNGHLAPGDPPTSAGLAQAVIKCLKDPCRHASLRRGALQIARRFSLANHIDQLEDLFQDSMNAGKQLAYPQYDAVLN